MNEGFSVPFEQLQTAIEIKRGQGRQPCTTPLGSVIEVQIAASMSAVSGPRRRCGKMEQRKPSFAGYVIPAEVVRNPAAHPKIRPRAHAFTEPVQQIRSLDETKDGPRRIALHGCGINEPAERGIGLIRPRVRKSDMAQGLRMLGDQRLRPLEFTRELVEPSRISNFNFGLAD